jgi:hypothetical protein
VSSVVLDVTRWAPWRPEDLPRLLQGVEAPWYVAAGWGLDLFLGGDYREHEDLEIGVPNGRIDEIAAALWGFELFVIVDPHEAVPLADARDRLGDTHQTWARDPATELWRLDVFREPSDDGTWICRRDPAIRLPYEQLIEHTEDGIPYGRPEVILLFKAKHAHLEKNRADFSAALPRLDRERRRWLREALERIDPGHAWLAELNGSGT